MPTSTAREEQFEQEFMGVVDLYRKYFELFGIEKYVMRLSLHSKAGLGKKYVDNERLWLKTEEMVRRAMDNGGVPYVEAEDEAAFYGPKIDVQIWSAIGKEFSLMTNQVDFAVPERFDLKFTNKEGNEEIPLCIHRAPLSTHERMVGFLLEHYAGNFPVWLSPEQVRVIPITDGQNEYAEKHREAIARKRHPRPCRSIRAAHERQDPPGAVDESAVHARGRRKRDEGRAGLAACARWKPAEQYSAG